MSIVYMCDICRKAIGSGSRVYSLQLELIKGQSPIAPIYPIGYSYDICESCCQDIKKQMGYIRRNDDTAVNKNDIS